MVEQLRAKSLGMVERMEAIMDNARVFKENKVIRKLFQV